MITKVITSVSLSKKAKCGLEILAKQENPPYISTVMERLIMKELKSKKISLENEAES